MKKSDAHTGEDGPHYGQPQLPKKPVRYEVHNRATGKTHHYKTGPAASRAMDRMDNHHGSYITTRKPIWED